MQSGTYVYLLVDGNMSMSLLPKATVFVVCAPLAIGSEIRQRYVRTIGRGRVTRYQVLVPRTPGVYIRVPVSTLCSLSRVSRFAITELVRVLPYEIVTSNRPSGCAGCR